MNHHWHVHLPKPALDHDGPSLKKHINALETSLRRSLQPSQTATVHRPRSPAFLTYRERFQPDSGDHEWRERRAFRGGRTPADVATTTLRLAPSSEAKRAATSRKTLNDIFSAPGCRIRRAEPRACEADAGRDMVERTGLGLCGWGRVKRPTYQLRENRLARRDPQPRHRADCAVHRPIAPATLLSLRRTKGSTTLVVSSYIHTHTHIHGNRTSLLLVPSPYLRRALDAACQHWRRRSPPAQPTIPPYILILRSNLCCHSLARQSSLPQNIRCTEPARLSLVAVVEGKYMCEDDSILNAVRKLRSLRGRACAKPVLLTCPLLSALLLRATLLPPWTRYPSRPRSSPPQAPTLGPGVVLEHRASTMLFYSDSDEWPVIRPSVVTCARISRLVGLVVLRMADGSCTSPFTIMYDPGIAVLRPHLVGDIKPAVRKAIERYLLITFEIDQQQARATIPDELSHWGKISFLGGGDKMRCADLNRYSERHMTRDASFIKYSHEVDKNARHPRRPVVLERRIAYGQLLEILEFRADLPTITDEDNRITQRPADLLLAVVRPVKLTQKNKLGTPYYQDGQFGPIEVVDVDDLSCLVARIPDHGSGPKKWALCERFDAMGASAQDSEE
uniref:Uncharacterized protein n=1 Tax=Mycena chlorophos TaxID=658473 RepID=A0ABQ0LP00_MYCCL|nr:predicted protein [Mycena chlorophos]